MAEKKPLVAVMDVDGVIYDYVGELAKVAALHLGRPAHHFPPAECWDFMVDQWGMTMDEYFDLVHVGVIEHNLMTDGVPLPGALAGWKSLRESGARIHVATNCGFGETVDQAQANRREWMESWGFEYDEIEFTSDKASVARRYIDEGYAVAALDDHVKNYNALRATGAHAYLLHQRWNRDVVTSSRVRDVDEFVVRMRSITDNVPERS